MPTVVDTLVQLERQCLGLRVPCLDGRHWFCWHAAGSSQHAFVSADHRLDVQYELVGPGGGTWHVTVRLDEGELRPGASADPRMIVSAAVEDWLALWTGAVTPTALLGHGRLSVLPEELAAEASLDLPRLGLLGPLRELEYAAWDDVACAHGGLCPHEGPRWPPTLDHLTVRPLAAGVTEGLEEHNAPPEAARLRWVSMLAWSLLVLAAGAGLGVGLAVGFHSLLGGVAALLTAGTLYWFLKHPIVRGLRATCRRSPRAFRLMLEVGLIHW